MNLPGNLLIKQMASQLRNHYYIEQAIWNNINRWIFMWHKNPNNMYNIYFLINECKLFGLNHQYEGSYNKNQVQNYFTIKWWYDKAWCQNYLYIHTLANSL